MKKHGPNILRILISVGVLFFLFREIVSLDETLEVLLQADLCYLLTAFLLFLLSLVIRAYRWLVLLRGLDPMVPFGRLLRLYFVGTFFNAFLPTSFGGDVVRAMELTRHTNSSAAIGTVLLDRMTGLLVLFVMGLVVLPFHAASLEPWLVWLLLIVAGGGLIAGALVLEGRFLRRLTEGLPAPFSLAGQGSLAGVYAAVTSCGRQAILSAFAVSVAFNVINVLINWLCGQAMGTEIDLGYFFVVTPLLSVSGLVPSIGGWGVREAVSTAIFAPAGASANVATALAMALGGITLMVGLIGGVLYGIERLRSLRIDR